MPFREKYLFLQNPLIPGSHQGFAQEVAGLFTVVRQRHKAFSDDRERRFADRLSQLPQVPFPPPPNLTHPILFDFEREYIQGGANPRAFIRSLLLRYRGRLRSETVSASEIRLHGTVNGIGEDLLGTLYLAGRRFEAMAAQPPGVVHRVYQRRGQPNRHYVLLDSGIFVRRYVIRGLNNDDVWNLNQGLPLQAAEQDNRAHQNEVGNNRHALNAGGHMLVEQQIVSHTRGWKKRFISTGISNRPAISTWGVAFHSIYGAVVIDLAMVPRDQIFDVHKPEQAARVFGVPVENIVAPGAQHGSPANDHQGELYLGLRDVLRTRELLIKNSVPFAAVYGPRRQRRLLAVAGNNSNRRRALRDAVVNHHLWGPWVEEHETIPRQWNNKRWSFILMRQVGQAQMVHNPLRGLMTHPSQEVHRLDHYVLTRPPVGMP